VRIAFDIRRINEFGVGTYTRNIIRALAQLDHENKYFLLGPTEKVAEIGKLPENFKAIPLPAADTFRGYLQCRTVLKRLATQESALPVRSHGARHARVHVSGAWGFEHPPNAAFRPYAHGAETRVANFCGFALHQG
jgi:hypothetical protein